METVVVVGAAGAVGEGVVRAGLGRGFRIITVDPGADRLVRSLPAELGGALDVVAESIAAPGVAERIGSLLERSGKPLDAVVVALGGRPEPMSQEAADPASWGRAVSEFLVPHLAAARTLLPMTPKRGYLTLMGSAALQPIAGETLASLQGAALRALVEGEITASSSGPALGLAVSVPVVSYRLDRRDPAWPDAQEVGTLVWKMFEDGMPSGIYEVAERGQRLPRRVV